MTILITVDVAGQTRAGYEGMIALLADVLRNAPGFLFHGAYPDDRGGWRIVEAWSTKQDADRFFATHVAPNLPAGVRPKRELHELAGCVRPAPATGMRSP